MIIARNLTRNKITIFSRPFIQRYFSIKRTELTENEFLNLWEEFYDDLTDKLESETLSNKIEDYQESAEAISIECQNNKVFVINRHTHNKEVWYSSPISGPCHFSRVDNKWINLKGREIIELLKEDLHKL